MLEEIVVDDDGDDDERDREGEPEQEKDRIEGGTEGKASAMDMRSLAASDESPQPVCSSVRSANRNISKHFGALITASIFFFCSGL